MSRDLLTVEIEAARAKAEALFTRVSEDPKVHRFVKERIAGALDQYADALQLLRTKDRLQVDAMRERIVWVLDET